MVCCCHIEDQLQSITTILHCKNKFVVLTMPTIVIHVVALQEI